MSSCVFSDGTTVGDYLRPYIVAEVNSSHNGNMETARKMIDAAADCGCDCVKFQSWSASSLYSKTYYRQNPIAKRFVDKFSLSPEQLKELSAYCREKGVAFSSTPYSEEEADFLAEECEPPFLKIASMEINNPRFLRYIGEKRLPVVLSTGMSGLDEVERAVGILEESGVTQMVLLHCVSIYPTVLTTVNLNNIPGLRERFGNYPVGFSDHTEGDAAAVAATALGAALIEKHLTLDHTKVGMDNGMATEPEALRALVTKCRDVQLAMGSRERVVLPEELKQRLNMRRSIVARRDVPKGTVLTEADLYAKRPGTGIAPDRMEEVLGRTALHDLEADTLILPEDLG